MRRATMAGNEDKRYYVPPIVEGTTQTDPNKSKRAPTAAERLKESFVQGAEAKAMAKGLGIDTKDGGKGGGEAAIPASEVGQMMTNAMNQYMQSYMKGITDLMGQVIALKGKEGEGSNKSQFMDYLLAELKSMKDRLEGGYNVDPFQMIVSYNEMLAKVQEQTKKALGFTEIGNVGGVPNIEVMKLMLDREDRITDRQTAQQRHEKELQLGQQRHDEEMAERRRRWEVEDKRWDADFGLRLAEIKQENAGKAEMMGQFKDMGGAFLSSLQVTPAEGAGPQAAAPKAVQSPPAEKVEPIYPTSMMCQNPECKKSFEWPTGKMKANCPHCGLEYELEPQA